MAGHGSSMAGILVEGGKFDWMQNDKFPTMTKPYEGYHGLSFAEEFGPVAFTMKARAEGMRDFGPCLSPQNAWNVMQGIETLSVRMEKHCANAEKMVEFLSNHESVAWVSHASVPDHPDHELAKKLLPIEAFTSMFTFLVLISVFYFIPTGVVIMWSPSVLGAGLCAILYLSEVVVGVISAGILTDETFGWREVVGSTMIVLGGVLAVVLAPKDEK